MRSNVQKYHCLLPYHIRIHDQHSHPCFSPIFTWSWSKSWCRIPPPSSTNPTAACCLSQSYNPNLLVWRSNAWQFVVHLACSFSTAISSLLCQRASGNGAYTHFLPTVFELIVHLKFFMQRVTSSPHVLGKVRIVAKYTTISNHRLCLFFYPESTLAPCLLPPSTYLFFFLLFLLPTLPLPLWWLTWFLISSLINAPSRTNAIFNMTRLP